MKFNFDIARDVALRATYETLVLHSEYEMFGAEQVHKLLDQHFSLGYVRRLLSSLADEKLLLVDKYDPESEPAYSVSDDGIRRAEELLDLRKLLSDDQTGDGNFDQIPGSDRMVSINHNQQEQIETPVAELIKLVEAENSINGEQGVRELVLGRLRAGRELVRAGTFSVISLHLTLVIGLRLLKEKYGDQAIGIVAGTLLDLLLKQYGIG